MIVVTLMGGLGNQMFQYAFGRGVAVSLGRRLVLDAMGLPTGEPPHRRYYALDGLPLSAAVSVVGATAASDRGEDSQPIKRGVRRLALRLLERQVVREPGLDDLLPLGTIPKHLAFLRGYWQSPAYFEHVARQIRHELTPETEPGGRVERLLERLADETTIAVHVRRGDYATVSSVASFHGLQDVAYYRRAVETIAIEVGGRITAVVVSDDPQWAERDLKLDVPVVHAEAESPLSQHETLALMSRCHHHVIANSSFSWWGAWLAQHASQRVIYPERWFLRHEVDPKFRFPSTWRAFASDGRPTAS